MEKIIEAINKSRSSQFMQEAVKNFCYKLDEGNKCRIDLAFELNDEKNVNVKVSLEKLNESYAVCKVHTDFQQYESRVPYGILSEFINGIVKETQEFSGER